MAITDPAMALLTNLRQSTKRKPNDQPADDQAADSSREREKRVSLGVVYFFLKTHVLSV